MIFRANRQSVRDCRPKLRTPATRGAAMKTPILIALAGLLISSAQTAEPTGTLALACQGTTHQWGEQSTSTMHLAVNLSTGTVGGFRDDADIFYGVAITAIDDEIVRFRGAEISGEEETLCAC